MGATAFAAEGSITSIGFSDASRPGEVRIQIGNGRIIVRGSDEPQVTVSSSSSPKGQSVERKDGLRVISTVSSFSLTEKDNVIEFTAGMEGPGSGGPGRFEVRVPRSAALSVTNTWGGDITVENITGDVEIKNLGGEIVLTGLAGGALVETLNGRIEASYPSIPANKPISFTSMNGDVQLRVPAETKANVRFRTQNGNVLTDFEEANLVTQTETMSPSAMEEMARAAGETARAAAETARAAAEAAREKIAEVAEQVAKRREAAERRTDVERRSDRDSTSESSSSSSSASASASSNTGPRAPKPPRPPSIPSLSGGKIVQGTLNGGGTEIQIATMNGDIILRKQAP